jgi:cytochrome o ubiquinol oxidase subunit III
MSTDVVDAHHDHHQAEEDSRDIFGFWMYIMTDCLLFATLFAAFAVLRHSTFGGPQLKHLIDLHYVFGESMFLLASNLTYGFALLCMYKHKQKAMVSWLVVTILLGLSFVGMEVNEFLHLAWAGHGPQASGAMSAFFALVGTHGLHVTIGLIWMTILTVQLARFKTSAGMLKRFTYLGLFWNFLDIVWIFVFTIVYLYGVL